jgi:hypothetical protein
MKYQAKYLIEANEYSAGGSRPYKKEDFYDFSAGTDFAAKTIAEDKRIELKRNLLQANVKLESLVRIGKIIIQPKEKVHA